MQIVNKKVLNDFSASHPDAEEQIKAWRKEARKAAWKTPNELKQRYAKASILKGGSVVFDICGNTYRLWVKISFSSGVIFVKKIGTHKEYDKWDIK